MSLLAPANAVAGMMPGGGLLPTPNPLATVRIEKLVLSLQVFLTSVVLRFIHPEQCAKCFILS